MSSTTKVLTTLFIIYNLSNIYAGAIVEDRSILLDTEINSISKNRAKMANNLSSMSNNKLAYNDESLINNGANNRPVVTYTNNNDFNENDDSAAQLDLESVSKDYKGELPNNNLDSRSIKADEQYAQEMVIPNANNSRNQNVATPWSDSEQRPTQLKVTREATLKELESMPLNARMLRIENILETQKNLDSKIIAMQEEIQRLNGVVDSQKHELKRSLEQQRLLLEDLDKRIAQSPASTKPISPAANATPNYQDNKLTEQELYTQAYSSIKTKDYAKSIKLFNKYLQEYPQGTFGANSNYWLGELYMIQSEYPKALAAFDNVLIKYPKNAKSADALYKQGLIHVYLKDFARAKKVLSEVKKQYQNTTAARLADKELQNIEKISNDA